VHGNFRNRPGHVIIEHIQKALISRATTPQDDSLAQVRKGMRRVLPHNNTNRHLSSTPCRNRCPSVVVEPVEHRPLEAEVVVDTQADHRSLGTLAGVAEGSIHPDRVDPQEDNTAAVVDRSRLCWT